MNVKKILKILGIILLVLFVLLVIHTIRNYIIITNLKNKFGNYANSTNYHSKSVATEGNGTIITINNYKKDVKKAVFIERTLNEETSKISVYNNGERIDRFTEGGDNKTVELNFASDMVVDLNNHLGTDNNWQTFIGSAFAKIKTTKYDDKKCYIISDFLSTSSLDYEGQRVYIEGDTGLVIKLESKEFNTEWEYEFDKVDDSIFVEPDISQYTLKENK